jgi:flagellar biosynthesis/type III secretory pathway protein FliH
MKKLFSNVGGNQFKLLTESVDKPSINESKETLLLREAIKKVLGQGEPSLKYVKLENMGIGFIKNIFEAKKVALAEARALAEEFGYKDNEGQKSFVKEDENDNMDSERKWTKVPVSSGKEERPSTEEKREVQIGKIILGYCQEFMKSETPGDPIYILEEIEQLAEELIKMHSGGVAHRTGFHQ